MSINLCFSQNNSSTLIVTENKKLHYNINKHFKYSRKEPSLKNIKKYLIKHRYYKFQILESKNKYTIQNPIQTVFVLKKDNFLKDHTFQKIIDIDEYRLSIGLYDAIQSDIKDFYRKNGFQQVKITRQSVVKKWKEWVYFKIEEGPRIKIGEIKIEGSFSKSPSKYINFILNNSTPLIKKGFYNKEDLKTGYNNLLNHLKSQGFLESKIYQGPITIKRDVANIKISIQEGPITTINNIRIKGNTLPTASILSAMKSKIHQPLNFVALEKDLKNIENFYQSRGYLQAKIKNKDNIISYKKDKKEHANLSISIDEGKIHHINKIFITGLKKVKEDLVKNLLEFKEGEILTLEKINDTKSNLNSLGIFSQISIDHKQKGLKTYVSIALRERKPRSIRGGIGLNSERSLTTRTYLEFSYNNLFGYGRSLTLNTSGQISLIELDPSLEYKISGRYKEVFIPGKNYEGNINISRSKDIFNYSEKNANAVHKDQLSFFINKSMGKNTNLTLNLFSFENRKESCINNDICPENLQKIGSIGFTSQWDNRDNIFNPEKGVLFSLSGEWASPELGSSNDISFWKLYFQKQFYYHFLDAYTLAFAVKGGMIRSQDTLPVSRAFILGGQSSIRAYDGNIEGDRIPSTEVSPIQTANEALKLNVNDYTEKVLESRYGLVKTELRFPIFKNFKGLLFYDAGLVYLKGNRNELTEYGHSAGIGMRFEIFLLPIGLDIAYKLPPKKGADYRFHFSIGFF